MSAFAESSKGVVLDLSLDFSYRKKQIFRYRDVHYREDGKGWDVLVPKVLDLHELAILSSIRVTDA